MSHYIKPDPNSTQPGDREETGFVNIGGWEEQTVIEMFLIVDTVCLQQLYDRQSSLGLKRF